MMDSEEDVDWIQDLTDDDIDLFHDGVDLYIFIPAESGEIEEDLPTDGALEELSTLIFLTWDLMDEEEVDGDYWDASNPIISVYFLFIHQIPC